MTQGIGPTKVLRKPAQQALAKELGRPLVPVQARLRKARNALVEAGRIRKWGGDTRLR